MARGRLLIAVMILAYSAPPSGHGAPLLIFSRSAPQGVKVIPAGQTDVAQHIIPRYANGTTHPAGQVLGWGPMSVIRGTSETQQTSPAGMRAIVVTEDFGEGTRVNQWQATPVAPTPATGTITGASSPTPPAPIVITSNSHGLPNGVSVIVSGVEGNTKANGTWIITVVDSDQFSLDNSNLQQPAPGTYAGGGTWTTSLPAVLQPAVRDVTIAGHDDQGNNYALAGKVANQPAVFNKITEAITNATNAMPIVVTSPGHTLATGAQVTITGVLGNTAANGTWTITTVDPDGMGPLTGSDGFSLNGSDGTGSEPYEEGGVWTSNYWGDLYGGAFIRGTGLAVENVQAFYIPGTAFHITRGGGLGVGAKLPFDREKFRVWDCNVKRAYRGFLIDNIDGAVGRLEGSHLRDYGIKFTSATQIDGFLHFWGVGEGGLPEAPAVWFPGGIGACWGGPMYAESSRVGIKIESSGNTLHDVYSHSCSVCCLDISSSTHLPSNNKIKGLTITNLQGPQPIGVRLGGQYNSIIGGHVSVVDGQKGIAITGGQGQRIEATINAFGLSNTTAIDVQLSGANKINNCVIIANVVGGDNIGTGNVALDLNDGGTSRLGSGNYIWLTTANWTSGDTKIDFAPSGNGTNNEIWLDGQRQTPP